MTNDLTKRLSNIRNAELKHDGAFELPLLILDNRVLFPQVLSLIPLTEDSQVNAAAYADQRGQTLIACKLRPEYNGSDLIDKIHPIGTEIAPGKYAEMADN